MKNRLQIRYHIPESLPTRAQAMSYLKETFAIGRTNSTNASLPAEPLVILYNDTMPDIANGITEAKRLETANVLLAIGRGGDGVNIFNNQDYFVIDFAKHEEEILGLTSAIDGVIDVIDEVKATIAQMQTDIAKNANDIANIVKVIGEKGDQCEKETVYGYIQCTREAIEDETNRAVLAEQELQHAIKDEETRAIAKENDLQTQIENETNRAQQAESDLQEHIDTEENARIEGDEINRDAIDAEVLRATTVENEIREKLNAETKRAQDEEGRIETRLNDEIARATAQEGELNAKIDNTDTRLSNEIDRANAAEKDLSGKISEEENARRVNDEALQGQITEVSHNLEVEASTRQSEDAKLEVKINDNSRRIQENQVYSAGKTIVVTGPTVNGTNLEVNVDNKTIVTNEAGTLSVSSDALVQYDGANAIKISDVYGGTKTVSLAINPNDNILTNDEQGLLATLSLKWSHADATGLKDEIQLIGKEGVVLSRIDVSDFIKDGILDSVTLDTTDKLNPTLVFTFNSASGKETIKLPVKDLVDIYNAGNGLQLNEKTFSIKIDSNSEAFLSVTVDGLKLSGVQTKINEVKQEVEKLLDTKTNELTGSIDKLTNDLTTERNERLADIQQVRTEYQNKVNETYNTVTNEYKAADVLLSSEITQKYKDADNVLNEKIVKLTTDVENNANSLNILAGDTSVDGSFKDVLFDSSLGSIVNTISIDDASEQSLIKKFTISGVPYFYASNKTSDMKHGDKTLNSVIDTLNENISDLNDEKQKIDEQLFELDKKLDKNASTLEIINNTLTVQEKLISDLQTDNANNKTFIAELQKLLFGIQETLSNITNDMAELKANAITTINGTDNEIKVEIRNNEDKIGHKAIIGFADDAYFVAGD